MTISTLCLLIGLFAVAQTVDDWPAIVQQPYENLPRAEIGLKPLLQTAQGAKITTREGWARERLLSSQAWLDRLGRPPEKPNKLDIETQSSEVLSDCSIRLVSFRSEGDDRIRAYLLIPAGLKEGERRPAVVVFHQSTKDTLLEPIGRGGKPELALALDLVRRGYITLSPECYIMRADGSSTQADALARRRPGWTGMGKITFDASRLVDYLESVPEVDKSRIGCIGHSLGAKEVLYAMAFEPRYRAGVFNEGGIGLRMSNWTEPWYLTPAIKEHIPAMENHQVLALIAPRPILVMAGNLADTDESWTFVAEARTVYELLEVRDHIGFYNHKAGHTLPPEARELAFKWLDHWLEFEPK